MGAPTFPTDIPPPMLTSARKTIKYGFYRFINCPLPFLCISNHKGLLSIHRQKLDDMQQVHLGVKITDHRKVILVQLHFCVPTTRPPLPKSHATKYVRRNFPLAPFIHNMCVDNSLIIPVRTFGRGIWCAGRRIRIDFMFGLKKETHQGSPTQMFYK